MQKLNEREFTRETYLDVVDDFRNDEECYFLDQMSIFGEDLDVVESQPITQAPPSTCQAKENQMVKQMNEICRIWKGQEVNNCRERNTP